MKSTLRIYINQQAIPGLQELINEAAKATWSRHDEMVGSVHQLLQQHIVLGRFTYEELRLGNLSYRNPVWIESDNASYDILTDNSLGVDRRIADGGNIISFFSVRHYFSVPAGKTVKLGHAFGTMAKILGYPTSDKYDSHVAWIVSYDPTRDNPFRYRLDIECENLTALSKVALKIIACEEINCE